MGCVWKHLWILLLTGSSSFGECKMSFQNIHCIHLSFFFFALTPVFTRSHQ